MGIIAVMPSIFGRSAEIDAGIRFKPEHGLELQGTVASFA